MIQSCSTIGQIQYINHVTRQVGIVTRLGERMLFDIHHIPNASLGLDVVIHTLDSYFNEPTSMLEFIEPVTEWFTRLNDHPQLCEDTLAEADIVKESIIKTEVL